MIIIINDCWPLPIHKTAKYRSLLWRHIWFILFYYILLTKIQVNLYLSMTIIKHNNGKWSHLGRGENIIAMIPKRNFTQSWHKILTPLYLQNSWYCALLWRHFGNALFCMVLVRWKSFCWSSWKISWHSSTASNDPHTWYRPPYFRNTWGSCFECFLLFIILA